MAPLDLTDFQRELVALIDNQPAPGKHSARNALRNLERAWDLLPVDREMALFRAITAEEEAATAVFHALQRHRYPGADRINWQNHDFKSAVMPFFRALVYVFADMQGLECGLQIDADDGPKCVKTWVKLTLPNGDARKALPIPPLHYELTVGDRQHDFANEIRQLASDRNVESVRQVVKSRANERNELLYASAQGIPNVVGDLETHLRHRQRDVFALLTAYLLIDPYRDHQLFVVQCLDAFLAMMDEVRRREGRASRPAT